MGTISGYLLPGFVTRALEATADQISGAPRGKEIREIMTLDTMFNGENKRNLGVEIKWGNAGGMGNEIRQS